MNIPSNSQATKNKSILIIRLGSSEELIYGQIELSLTA